MFCSLSCSVLMAFAIADADANQRRFSSQPVPQPFVIGNRETPLPTQFCVLAKGFCVTMRRQSESGTASKFKTAYFDQEYLQKHHLSYDTMKVEMASVAGIQTIELANDRRTVGCIYETDGGARELILLEMKIRDGKLFIVPPRAPDSRTGVVTPWLFRKKI